MLSYFVPHLGVYQAFANRKTLEVLQTAGLGTPPPIRSYYEKVVHYGLQTGWRERDGPCDRS
jgi:hypothetical protein